MTGETYKGLAVYITPQYCQDDNLYTEFARLHHTAPSACGTRDKLARREAFGVVEAYC